MEKEKPLLDVPTSNAHEAMRLTNPNFDITPYWDQLYVNLDEARITDQLSKLKFTLGLDENYNLTDVTKDYLKVMFAGHVGSGKSVELFKLHDKMNKSNGYLSVFLDFQEHIDINYFEAEDFFVMLITSLI